MDKNGKYLSLEVIDKRLKGMKIFSGYDRTYGSLADIALIELEQPLDIDSNTLPSLVDDISIEHLLSDQSSRRAVGFPLAKILQDNPKIHNKRPEAYHEIIRDTPLHISEIGVSKPFKPAGLKKDTIYWEQNKGAIIYQGNSGGAVLASHEGKPYYAGIVTANGNGGKSTTILPLKGKVMTELILPTLNRIKKEEQTADQAKNPSDTASLTPYTDVKLETLEFIPNDPKRLTFSWLKDLLLHLLPGMAQDAIFTWRLEKAIEEEDFAALLKAFRAKGPTNAMDILSLKDEKGCTLYLKLVSTWAPERIKNLAAHLTAAEQVICMEMQDNQGKKAADYSAMSRTT